jgi:hypothetical protein
MIRIATGSLDRSPAWSPDGDGSRSRPTLLARTTWASYAVDGGSPGSATPLGGHHSGPYFGTSAVAWSPDSTKVAYA